METRLKNCISNHSLYIHQSIFSVIFFVIFLPYNSKNIDTITYDSKNIDGILYAKIFDAVHCFPEKESEENFLAPQTFEW
jgi:hypothetical protein